MKRIGFYWTYLDWLSMITISNREKFTRTKKPFTAKSSWNIQKINELISWTAVSKIAEAS